MRDVRDTYIRQVVAGKSFADIGGLWGTVNEKVSVAHTHGVRMGDHDRCFTARQ